MGNLNIGPKDWPIYWVLIAESTNWTGAGIYTSEAGALNELKRLIEWDLEETESEDWDPEYLEKIKDLLGKNDIRELLIWWNNAHDGLLISIQRIATNSPIDPEEWFSAESYGEDKS